MISTIGLFTDLVIGFSVFAAITLWVAYMFFMPDLGKTRLGRIACSVLLAALCGLQLFHYQVWASAPELLGSTEYVLLLLLVPPSFYLFSRSVLLPDAAVRAWHALHYLPALFSFVLPNPVALIIAFALGAGYSLWFVQFVYGMRRSVKRYPFEMFFFAFFAVEALLVFLLAISLPYLDDMVFHLVYANFTGVALLLVVATMIIFPEVANDLSTAARLAYSKSTLDNVDVRQTLQRLSELMDDQKMHRDENLSLTMLADALGIGGHQLSELINSHFGRNFSAFVREKRVDDARHMLSEDQKSSILSIGMATGFRSQSNFYAAFREQTGESPGAYRKRLMKTPE